MRTAVSDSLVADGRLDDSRYKKHLLRVCIEKHSLFPI
jgi:hypothetical protein